MMCPLDIAPKDLFCLAFYFVLIDDILKTICLFCFSVFFTNMYPKIKITAKNWSAYGISILE